MIRFTKSLMLTPTQCFVSNKSCTCNKMFSYLRYVLISCPFEPMDFVNSVVHIRQSPLYDSYKYRPVLLKYSPRFLTTQDGHSSFVGEETFVRNNSRNCVCFSNSNCCLSNESLADF
jgi:hypothetical protein